MPETCQGVSFIQNILEPYQKELQVSYADRHSGYAAEIACITFRLPSCYCIRLDCMGGEYIYGGIGMKRKRQDGYYFLRGNRSRKAHIIDLAAFLSKAFLFTGIHQIQSSVNLPLVQDIIKDYLDKEGRNVATGKPNELAESILPKTPLPLKNFFRTYTNNGKEFFCLDEYTYLVSDAVNILCRVLEVYLDIRYENRHRSEIGRSIATAYITKKNIPKAVHGAMENTGFMDYFKYVEFDEDVDLASVRTIEKEFEVLNRAYFSGKAFKDVTLRFRRCWIVRRGDKQIQIKKGLPQSLKGYDSNGYSLFLCGNYRMKCTSVSPSGEIPNNDIPQFKLPTSNEKKSYIST